MPDPTDKLRRANLLSALHDQGLTGGQAKAAARLVDVTYDPATDEPTNLPDAIAAAKATYGDAALGTPGVPSSSIPDPALLAGGARGPVDENTMLVEASRRQMRR